MNCRSKRKSPAPPVQRAGITNAARRKTVSPAGRAGAAVDRERGRPAGGWIGGAATRWAAAVSAGE